MRAGTHVTLPYYWDMRSAGTYTPFFISSAQLAHTPMNHTHEHTHVSCHDYSHSFHHKTLFFSPCCKPCKLLCCVLHRFTHMLFRFELFFLYLLVTVLSLAYLFLNYFCYVYIQIHFHSLMFGPTCASNITFYFFSGHNCISTKW